MLQLMPHIKMICRLEHSMVLMSIRSELIRHGRREISDNYTRCCIELERIIQDVVCRLQLMTLNMQLLTLVH